MSIVRQIGKLLFKCINHNDEVYHYEKEGEKVIHFLKDFYSNDTMYLPPEYRASELMQQYKDIQNSDKKMLQQRLICDYIAGMMDSYAIAVYEKYSGNKFYK